MLRVLNALYHNMDIVDRPFAECSLLVPIWRIFHACKPLRKQTEYFWPSNSCPLCVTNLREWPVTSQVSAAGGKMAEHLRDPYGSWRRKTLNFEVGVFSSSPHSVIYLSLLFTAFLSFSLFIFLPYYSSCQTLVSKLLQS